jgi:hypothetical protein
MTAAGFVIGAGFFLLCTGQWAVAIPFIVIGLTMIDNVKEKEE